MLQDCEDGGRSEVVDREERSSALSDSFSDKINNLKQEMHTNEAFQLSPITVHTHQILLFTPAFTYPATLTPHFFHCRGGLRSADVRILRQLVAVHEGIEAMRWLMEERDNLASRDSSLTGSLSSLVTVEEHGPSMSPYRESLSPTQDLTETTGEESEDHPPHTDHGDSTHKSYLSPEFTRASPPSPSSKFEVNCSTQGRHDQASSSPANGLVSASLPKSQPQDLDIKDGAKTIRRALLRSRRASRPVIVDNGSFARH
ncbi:Leucine rich adaptor protein 1 [Larimichthys crocea]|uniref:Uncharacterized protein n=1 Tax=Larimichthys crocea TaxID=215358 RepID=A0ACD3QQX3_LARCR|nr:Leucine rich adaptor protein 1 [Larimichthys crocea]